MNNNPQSLKNSGQEIGVLLSIILLLCALYPSLNNGQIVYNYAVSALVILIISIIFPKILYPLHCVWMKFANILSSIVSPVVMGILFFVLFTPIGIVMRLCRKDLLKIRPCNKSRKTFWKDKDLSINSSMNKQF